MAYDYDAFIQVFNMDGERFFDKEDLVQHDYSDVEWDVDVAEPHIWSLDASLAIFLDKALTMMMACEHWVPIDGVKDVRDTFREYAIGDKSLEFEKYGTPERKSLEISLRWLEVNFTSLWT